MTVQHGERFELVITGEAEVIRGEPEPTPESDEESEQ